MSLSSVLAPDAVISRSSPAASPVAVISIPPAEVVKVSASAPVPVEESTSDESVAPVKLTVRSSPAPSVFKEILLAVQLPSMENPSESIVVKTTSADPI